MFLNFLKKKDLILLIILNYLIYNFVKSKLINMKDILCISFIYLLLNYIKYNFIIYK